MPLTFQDYYSNKPIYKLWIVQLADYLISHYRHIESLPQDPRKLMLEISRMKELKDLPLEDAAKKYFNLIHELDTIKHHEYLGF